MKKHGVCYGKLQRPETWNYKFYKNESEIYNFDKKEWELIWRK